MDIPISYPLFNNSVVTLPDQVTFDDVNNIDIWRYNTTAFYSQQLPIVIISAGYGATQSLEPSLGDISPFSELASAFAMQGYQTIVLDHEDIVSRNLSLLETRAKEINGVIDKLTNPKGQNIILVGHSLGAATVVSIGMDNKSVYNSSVSTIIAFSPPIADTKKYDLALEDWSHLNVPTLFMTGTDDNNAGNISYKDRLKGARLSAIDGNKDILTTVINGANHFSFGEYGSESDRDVVISISLAMSDRYNMPFLNTRVTANNFLYNAETLYYQNVATIDFYKIPQFNIKSANISNDHNQGVHINDLLNKSESNNIFSNHNALSYSAFKPLYLNLFTELNLYSIIDLQASYKL